MSVKNVLIVLLVGINACVTPCEQNRQWFLKNVYWQSYHGTITKKFIDYDDRAEPKVYLNGETIYSLYNGYVYDSVQINDLLIKQPHTLQFIVVRHQKGDSIKFYPLCGGEILKD